MKFYSWGIRDSYLVFVATIVLALSVVLFLDLVATRFEKLFPLPPQSQENREYAQDQAVIENTDTSNGMSNRGEKSKDTNTQDQRGDFTAEALRRTRSD